MRTLLAALCLTLASVAVAAPPSGLPAFEAAGFAQLREQKPELRSPSTSAADSITASHMIARSGKTVLYGYARTPEQAAEAIAYWSKTLRGMGVPTGAATYDKDFYTIPYTTMDGRAIRSFLADTLMFPPKDEAGLRANMALAQSALDKAGMNVVAARVVDVESMLPTYMVLYLTDADENPDHEKQLRVLKPGDDLDFDVFRRAGITVVQTPKPWMMAYIGPEVGYVSLIAKTSEEIAAKLAKRKEFLQAQGKRLIADKTEPLDHPDYKFAAAIYFFQ